MVSIISIKARQIFDSRGNPTVEVDLKTETGLYTAAVPSGASTGEFEALEMRDGGSAYMGKGVLNAVKNVNEIIAPALVGKDVTQQAELDRFMVEILDGTQNEWGWCKKKLGANAILGVSLALCRAGAAAKKQPLWQYIADLAGNPTPCLPVPSFNIINGGSHAGNKLAMQEFMILPVGATSFTEAMQIGSEVYHNLKKVIKGRYGLDATAVGDEGGFAPNIQSNGEAIDLIEEAIKAAGYTDKVKLGMDVAASEFYTGATDARYNLDFKNENAPESEKISADKLTEVYEGFIAKCKNSSDIVSIEDPFDQDDWESWINFTSKVGNDVQIVGDDLTVTNPTRVQKAIDTKACNALLLKVNQIGSITESIEAVTMAKKAGWAIMTSHRSGETEDTFIADLAVGLSAGQIKTGAPCRSERLAKYNQLLRIEEELGANARYAGADFRNVEKLGKTQSLVTYIFHPNSGSDGSKDRKGTMVSIISIKARQIFDSRGNPTVEVDLKTETGLYTAAVPSGASTGEFEALEMRDGGSAYMGKGVLNAVKNVNEIIAPALVGKDVTQQAELDRFMVEILDGTQNEWGWCKKKLGANAILGVSLALCRAGAAAKKQPLWQYIADLAGNPTPCLPVPSFNIINGGSHAGNKLAMQEFMILPVGATSFTEAMQIGSEVYHNLKKVIKGRYGLDATAVGDEGGFAPNIQSNGEAIDLIEEAIKAAGYTDKVKLGMDVAASEFYTGATDARYNLDFKNENAPESEKISADKLTEVYEGFIAKCKNSSDIVSIEDPFDQDDWESWINFTSKVGNDVQIVGDDLTVTNPTRVQKAIDTKACNALLLKVNQIGSITESIEAVTMAKKAGWAIMTSHRSGETEDTFIADLAVGLSAGQIKTGAPCRSERLAKYNQLLRIEEELGANARYAGADFRNVEKLGKYSSF
ncbi:hypothetical protein BBO99_00006077 [Phytophthora kernoviae]|uniref:phosphopyruvate hydratase n=1 Tax=Phytophthora kernoviae TaxID=325452 RepID=A0A3R7MT66_9STRA|nr:hypothetical protein JM16_005828 [Phytophthora kernoviae]RLN32711.1 hypothetical protein BBI17_006100 [Phytophthora kernoviae]RLN78281.1 hypothetical protein BBO99_00006077 [Phytophthora kernoviae]